ncbi:MAG: hypothetical protein WCF67_25105 [Chitinophagaceae bacterium]
MTIESLQPYFALINAVVSLAVLGIVFKLIKTHRETINERINALKDRLEGSKEDSERKDKWFTIEKEHLEKEKKAKEGELLKLQVQLDEILKKEGLTFQNLALGQSLQQSTNEVRALIEELTVKMTAKLELIVKDKSQNDFIVSESQLTIAKAQMAKGNFDAAAQSFDEYTMHTHKQDSWEVYFSKGVNLANLRQGRESNLNSVKAYNDAINSLPDDVDGNVKARLFGYRGAILKRLNRFDEAISDLTLALGYATGGYEIDDIHYNLACVYALQGQKEKMLLYIRKLKTAQKLHAVQYHLRDYFKKFSSDKELIDLLSTKITI